MLGEVASIPKPCGDVHTINEDEHRARGQVGLQMYQATGERAVGVEQGDPLPGWVL